jgi:hypothetical protein
MAICYAEVETEKGIFSGIGDATPQNVGKMIVAHLLRMSETRAKARALRDAINVGATAFEELADDDDAAPAGSGVGPAPAKAPQRQVGRHDPPTPKALRPPAQITPATEEQRKRVETLRHLLGQPAISTQALTTEAAAQEIAYWTAIAESQQASEAQYTNLVTQANQLHQATRQTIELPDGTITVAAYERLILRLRELKAAHEAKQPAMAAK